MDPEGFADRCAQVAHHLDTGIHRRFAQTALRDYLVLHPDDSKGLTDQLWINGDEVVRTSLRELLLHMVDNHAESLSTILPRIVEKDGIDSLADLWRVREVRSPEAATAWRTHIEEGGERP